MYKIWYCNECDKEFKLLKKYNSGICNICNNKLIRKYHSNILTKEIKFIQDKEDLIHDLKKDLNDNMKDFQDKFKDI